MDKCPECGVTISLTTRVGGQERDSIRRYDPGVCADCGAILVYDDPGYRLATEDELSMLRKHHCWSALGLASDMAKGGESMN